MPSNFTEHYHLSQWERTDKVLMEDFNADNAKIDGVLTELAQRTDSVESALAGMLNGRVYITSYVGNGINVLDHSPRIELPAVPDVLLVFGSGCLLVHLPATGHSGYILSIERDGLMGVKWEGSTVTLEQYSSNVSSEVNRNVTYFAIALYQAK